MVLQLVQLPEQETAWILLSEIFINILLPPLFFIVNRDIIMTNASSEITFLLTYSLGNPLKAETAVGTVSEMRNAFPETKHAHLLVPTREMW